MTLFKLWQFDNECFKHTFKHIKDKLGRWSIAVGFFENIFGPKHVMEWSCLLGLANDGLYFFLNLTKSSNIAHSSVPAAQMSDRCWINVQLLH